MTSARRADEFVAHLQDVLEKIGPIEASPFFGGVALRLDGRQFAMVMNGQLYFAVDDATRPRYEHRGSESFAYATRRGRVTVSAYMEVPADVLEDHALLRAWAWDAAQTRVT